MASELSREDVLFGRAVLAFKLATRDALDACLAEKRSAAGEPRTLARIAIDRGVLTAEQYRSLVEEVKKRGAAGDAASALPNVSEGGAYAPAAGAAPVPKQVPDPKGNAAAARFERHAHEVVATGSSLSVVTSSISEAREVKAAAAAAPPPAAAAVRRHPTDAAIRKKLRVKTETFDFGGCTDLVFLGAGSVGAVYKGRDNSGQIVAIKACADQDSGDKSFRRFLQERRVVQELQHPGIVRVHEIAISDDLPYFTMDFLEGPKLEVLLADKRPEREVLLDVVSKLADAVAYAHDKGIVLRDVHPGNVIVRTTDGAPILMDLGFAKDQNASIMLTAADAKIGMPLYSAPEVQMNPKKASAQSDVYSLGVILYRATCGKAPYDAPSSAGLLELMAGTDPKPPSSVDATSPGTLDAVCARALARDPAARYANARAFLEDLEKARRAPPPPAAASRGLLGRLFARLGFGKRA
jgi:hypothetical protein